MGNAKHILAYCAGLIDADGTIGIKRNTYAVRVRKDSQQPSYSERIHIRQVTREGLDLLSESFGGTVGREDPHSLRGQSLYRWGQTDLKATATLRQLIPFLRIKKEQAKNCLALRKLKEKSKKARIAKGRGHVGAASRPESISISMEQCYLNAKVLNKVGK